ncbi:MAG: NADPH-dependent FMN reductase [Minisyncoccota bacterium]
MKIVALSGSLRKDSYNTMLVRAFAELASADMEIEMLNIGDLPLYSQDDETAYPPVAQAMKDKIASADGIIIVTPEYNRSIPGTLKNAIDWLSRPYGQNSFARKPVLVAGVSIGKIGTAVAQSHLKQILVYLDADVIGQPEIYLGPAQEVFDTTGALTNDSTKELLRKALEVLASRGG